MIRAIRNKKRQQAVVIFRSPLAIFTSEDIAVNGGIELSELLNSEENLTMGRAVQSEIKIALINDNNQLSSVDFEREFTVSLGVEVATGTRSVRSGATMAIVSGNTTITASPAWDCVYHNDTAYAISGRAASLLMYRGQLFVCDANGDLIKAFWVESHGFSINPKPEWNAFMKAKAAKGLCLSIDDWSMEEFTVSNGVVSYKTTELTCLGYFTGKRPDKVKTNIVTLTAYDRMQRFEKIAPQFTYPTTLAGMYVSLCDHCGVRGMYYGYESLNMDMPIKRDPFGANTVTCREVLSYIAEAACCYAFIDEYGDCILRWFWDMASSPHPLQTIFRTDYFSIDVAEYAVKKIDKLQVHVTQDDIGVIVGDGTNGYDIVNNPLLSASTDAEIRPYAEAIYNRLAEFREYSPITVNGEGLWTFRCGDIINVETDDGVFQPFPIFARTIRWAGSAKAVFQSTGEPTRGVMSATNREKLTYGRNFLEISKSIDGLTVKAQSVQETAEEAKTAATTAAITAEEARVTATRAETNLSTMEERVSAAELSIKPDAITTTVTSSVKYNNDLAKAKSDAVSEANADTDDKLKNYSTTEEMSSAITQKADSITSTVSATYATKTQAQGYATDAKTQADAATDAKLKSYSTTTQMNSAIEQKANSITSTVSATYSTKEQAQGYATEAKNAAINNTSEQLKSYSTTTQMNSAIDQKADSITSTVSKTYSTKTEAQGYADTAKSGAITQANSDTDAKLKSYSTTSQMNSAINQKADSITSTVSATYSTKAQAQGYATTAKDDAIADTTNKLKNYSTTSQMNSAIEQRANSISLRVEEVAGIASATPSAVKNSSVEINTGGVAIKTGGTFTVASKKFDINENGEMSATNAIISGKLQVDGNDVWHKGDLVVSSVAPSSPKSGMIWVKPDTSSIPAAGTWTHAQLDARPFKSPYNLALTGTSIGAAPSNATYTYEVSVPIYHSFSNSTAYTCTVYLGASSGAQTINMGTKSISQQGSSVHTFTATSSTWLGNSATIYMSIVLSNSGYFSVDSYAGFSCKLTAKSNSGGTGWKNCTVQMYV